ncbi:hypothetical protein [Candidatus Nitrospira neomarina]|uniref:Uncharacterized protein n=1 Tax=Candidatus Nitrospira neomarina TaxID=3020899 RepID=A0AA96GL17_9BACT|nr:hypothetical protein [Candidatus Nitrospira neomarina]WNM62335.1 hypothetical protein PQG83_00900 [Candidatus Nitrospira neomarina]
MLGEAIIAMLTLMFVMWSAAIWASFKEDTEHKPGSLHTRKKVA